MRPSSPSEQSARTTIVEFVQSDNVAAILKIYNNNTSKTRLSNCRLVTKTNHRRAKLSKQNPKSKAQDPQTKTSLPNWGLCWGRGPQNHFQPTFKLFSQEPKKSITRALNILHSIKLSKLIKQVAQVKTRRAAWLTKPGKRVECLRLRASSIPCQHLLCLKSLISASKSSHCVTLSNLESSSSKIGTYHIEVCFCHSSQWKAIYNRPKTASKSSLSNQAPGLSLGKIRSPRPQLHHYLRS